MSSPAVVDISRRRVVDRYVIVAMVYSSGEGNKKAAFWGGLEPGNGVSSTWRGIEIPCARIFKQVV